MCTRFEIPVVFISVLACAGLGLAATKEKQEDRTHQYNLRIPASRGHSGRIVLLPGGQIHEGVAEGSNANPELHFHSYDPNTGVCNPRGVTVCSESGLSEFAFDASSDILALTPSSVMCVEAAIRADDWQQLAGDLGTIDEAICWPVPRLIFGHAYLALNRNNESLLLFASADGEGATKEWLDWTAKLLKRCESAPASHYLHGDAAARVGDWNIAVSRLGQAIAIHEDYHLALNARALVYVLMEMPQKALVDLDRVTKIAPGFADGHASLGTYWMRTEAYPGASEAYQKALQISPNFGCALNGKACELATRCEWNQAGQIYERCADCSPLALVAQENLISSRKSRASMAVRAITESKAGTSLRTSVETQRIRDQIVSEFTGWSPEMVPSALRQIASRNQVDMATVTKAFTQALPQILQDQWQPSFDSAMKSHVQAATLGISAEQSAFKGFNAKIMGGYVAGFGTLTSLGTATFAGAALWRVGGHYDTQSQDFVTQSRDFRSAGDAQLDFMTQQLQTAQVCKDTLTGLLATQPYYYKTPLSGNLGQDATSVRMMTDVSANHSRYIVAADPQNANIIRSRLIRTHGILGDHITVMPPNLDFSVAKTYSTMETNFGPGSTCILHVPKTEKKIGGVTTDMSNACIDYGNWEFQIPFGLLY